MPKALTGGDAIKARYMRQDFFTFNPTHKLLVAANHRPTIRGTDHATWRRILLVPFNVTFSGAEKDPELPGKLRTEMPGILKWAVEGCIEWQRDRLNPPPTVLEATSEYRNNEDVVGQFIAERCVVANYASVSASDLYSLYRAWATGAGEVPATQTRFGRSLHERGFDPDRKSGLRLWRGIGIMAVGADEVSHDRDDSAWSNGTGSVGDPLCDEPPTSAISSRVAVGADPLVESSGGKEPLISDPGITGYDGCDGFSYMAAHREIVGAAYVGKTRQTCHSESESDEKPQQVQGVTGAAGGDGFGNEPVMNPSDPSRRGGALNERPPPWLNDLLVRLRQVAPNLHVDAAGNLAGFGTLARWPEDLLAELDARCDAVRAALAAERRERGG